MTGYPDTSPHDIPRPAVTQRWEDVTMVSWRVDPSAVAALLPAGLAVDTFDGSAWVSLVPFRMVDLTFPPLPVLPVVGAFPETNIRTYVTGPAGPAVWFCSLDVPLLVGLPVARLAFGQPYTWSRMRVDRRGEEIRYLGVRRWPAPSGARSHVGVRVGRVIAPDDRDRWLTNRWGAYSTIRGRLHHAAVGHSPWVLREATPTVLSDGYGAAVGLPLGVVEVVRFAGSATGVGFAPPRPV